LDNGVRIIWDNSFPPCGHNRIKKTVFPVCVLIFLHAGCASWKSNLYVSSSRAAFVPRIVLIDEAADRRSHYGYLGASKIQVPMILNRKESTLMILFVVLAVSSCDIKACFLNSDGDH